MATLVYGPQAFVVGADTGLNAFDPNFTDISSGGGIELSVRTATNDLRKKETGGSSVSKWVGVALVDESVFADIFSGPASAFYGLRVRANTFATGYLVQWHTSLTLLRITAGPVFTPIAGPFGTVAINTLYPNAFLRAVNLDANTVRLTFGDGTNGSTFFDDTDPARYMTGAPGFDAFDSAAALSGSFDNVSIFDETATPAAGGSIINPMICSVGQLMNRR